MSRNLTLVQLLSRVQLFAASWTATARLLCPWDFPGKSTGVGCHALLQGIISTQGSNPCLMSSALAGVFLTTSTTWEDQGRAVSHAKFGGDPVRTYRSSE